MRIAFITASLGLLLSGASARSEPVKATGEKTAIKSAAEKPAALQALTGANQAGILYGRGYAYILSAPKGWVMDDETGRSEGLEAVFYRQGESWAAGKAVLYANVAPKVKGQDDTLAKIIQYDLDHSRQQDPEMKSTAAEPVETGDGRKATVYTFDGPGTGRSREKIAYIDTPNVVVMLVLTARAPGAYEKALPDFQQLVRSFHFLADRVTVRYQSPRSGQRVKLKKGK